MKFYVKELYDCSTTPTRANKGDAGWDLYSCEDVFLQAGERRLVDTGIALEIPTGYVGLIWPRSGLSVKNGIDVLAGVIDSGYRDSIKVCLLNTNIVDSEGASPSKNALIIKKGDRIAQILIQEVPEFELEKVHVLNESIRGVKGFGSSGV